MDVASVSAWVMRFEFMGMRTNVHCMGVAAVVLVVRTNTQNQLDKVGRKLFRDDHHS